MPVWQRQPAFERGEDSGLIRVIAGRFKGQRLEVPRGSHTRPTADRVKEAVFSMLVDVEGVEVLDLFAGSGSLGIEALSRGARRATFVESRAPACAVVRRNLDRVGVDHSHMAAEAIVIRSSAEAFLRRAAREKRRYGLVFIDPPYRIAARLHDCLSSDLPKILLKGARVVAESSPAKPLSLGLNVRAEKRYGDTLVRIYELEEEEP